MQKSSAGGVTQSVFSFSPPPHNELPDSQSAATASGAGGALITCHHGQAGSFPATKSSQGTKGAQNGGFWL